MKIVFFCSTNMGLSILESLNKEHQVVAVVTTPDSNAGRKQELVETPISVLAKQLNLNLLKPESLKNNPEFLSTLKDLGAELFVVVAYGKILPTEYLNMPKYKILNAHPSLLPKYRGPSPMRWALLNGDKITGVTFILLDELVDHGPILTRLTFEISPDDTDFSLTNKLGQLAATVINKVIADYVSGKLIPLSQDDSHASFTRMVNKDDGKIDWQKSAQEIYNMFRAYYPWPGIWTVWEGKKLKITECQVIDDPAHDQEVGMVLQNGIVACGQNTLFQIKNLQLEGKKETDITSFLNGYKSFIGTRLNGS